MSFLLIIFVVVVILLMFNAYVFDIVYQTKIYYQRKAMAVYFLQRQEVLKNIILLSFQDLLLLI